MYRPTYTKAADNMLAFELIKEFPLATVISIHEGEILTNLLPMIYDSESHSIIGHMARNNPHWKKMDQAKVTLSFRGPDRYISPTFYENKLNVPTWNYSVVEVRGRAEVSDSLEHVEGILGKSVDLFENANGTDWKYDLPEKFKSGLVKAIVGIKVHIETIEAKFKLSQNRETEDYKAVSRFLQNSQKESDRELLRWMNKTSPNEN